MTEVVEEVELQFVKLQRQIELEKKLCDNLENQLSAIKKNTKYTEENNESKCRLKESTILRNQCTDKNISSSEASLKTTTEFVNDFNKLAELQNVGLQRKKLAIQKTEYEKKWDSVQETYNCLPIANQVKAFKKIRKQNILDKMLKDKEKAEIKRAITTYTNFKDKQTKALTVKLAKFSLKIKQKYKKILGFKERTRYLAKEVEKLRAEESSLMGNKCTIVPPSHLFRRPKMVEEIVVLPSNNLGRKSKIMNMNQRRLFSPTDVTSMKLPQLMVPTFTVSSCTQNRGQTELSSKNSDMENNIPEITLDDSETLREHMNENVSLNCFNKSKGINTDRPPTTNCSRNLSEKIHAKSYLESKPGDNERNINHPVSANKEINMNEGGRSTLCELQPNSTGIPGTIGIAGSRKVQHEFLRKGSRDKSLLFNLDSASQENSKDWEFLN